VKFVNRLQIPNLVSRRVLKATLITLCFILTVDLQIKIAYLNLFLDTLLSFSLLALISYLDTNKYSNVVEHINWVLSELSVVVHKMPNRIDRICISLI